MTTHSSQIKKSFVLMSLGVVLLGAAAGCKSVNVEKKTANGPVIVNQTRGEFINKAGEDVEFKVVADGSGPLAYQWFYQPSDDAAPVLVEEHNERIDGANTAVLKISRTKTDDTGFYWCRVSQEDLKRGGIIRTQSQPVFLYASTYVPGYGVIHTGNTTKICPTVGTYTAYSVITACPDGTPLWKPDGSGAPVTVSVPYPTAWIAVKLIGNTAPCDPCSGRGTLTFKIPPGTSDMWFTVYFPFKPGGTSGVTMTHSGIVIDCN